MTPKDDSEAPVNSHEGLSPLSSPNTNDKLSKSTADKGPEITVTVIGESDERNGGTTQSPTPRSEQPINGH